MKKRLVFLAGALALGLLMLRAEAQLWQPIPLGTPSGGGGGGGGTFDLDIAASSVHGWWGMEAASAADRGTAAFNLCLPDGTTCANVSTDATTGQITPTTIAAAGFSTCNNTTVLCRFKILYIKGGNADSTGNLGLTSALISAGVTTWPILVTPGGCPGAFSASLYCMLSGSAGSDSWTTTISTLTCPCSLMALIYDNNSASGYADLLTHDSLYGLYSHNGVVDFYIGTDQNVTGTAYQNWYVAAGVTGAKAYANGTSVTASGAGSGSTNTATIGNDCTCYFFKFAMWDTAVSDGNMTSIISNTRTRLGF